MLAEAGDEDIQEDFQTPSTGWGKEFAPRSRLRPGIRVLLG